jgi:hypothetical protein
MPSIQKIGFNTWCDNHSEDHDARWFRELYPWKIFQLINFDENLIGVMQKIMFNSLYYYIIVESIELQENCRYKSTFSLKAEKSNTVDSWNNRLWNEKFQIIYSEDFTFITVFTKGKDPSKLYLKNFIEDKYAKIEENRSKPILYFLFKSLVSWLINENYPKAKYQAKFDILKPGIRKLNTKFLYEGGNFYPLYSLDRDFWITYSFTEEKAHRLALTIGNQCMHMIIIYCNPTFRYHHRSKDKHIEILSLYEYCARLPLETQVLYNKKIKLLQNYMVSIKEVDINHIKAELAAPRYEFYPINNHHLMEALSIMKIYPENDFEAFYYFSAMNLINAWLSNRRKEFKENKSHNNLYKDMYSFKAHLLQAVKLLLKLKVENINIYINDNLLFMEVFTYQFSFHSFPIDAEIRSYQFSKKNQPIIWSGIRLQPLAPLLIDLSRSLKNSYYQGLSN